MTGTTPPSGSRPRLLDLFCCQGGAGEGYQRAGFDVTGVDIQRQPRNPHRFIEGDALGYLAAHADEYHAIHASPPCPLYSRVTGFHPGARDRHPDLVGPVRELLIASGKPWVMENVPGAPLRRDLVLCGEMFGLRVHRHRWFELSFLAMGMPHAPHRLKGAKTNGHIEDGYTRWVTGHFTDLADAGDAMGIDWMDKAGLAQAIPPAYTEFIGAQLMAHITSPLLERAA
jgi:DNA (cytosine-5)-methyltransferase 1